MTPSSWSRARGWPARENASNRQARTPPATIGPWRKQRLLISPTISTARRTQPRLRFHSMVSTTRSTCRRRMLLRWRRLSSRTSMRLPRSAVEAHERDAQGVLDHRDHAKISPSFVNGRASKASKCPTEAGFRPLSSNNTTPSTRHLPLLPERTRPAALAGSSQLRGVARAGAPVPEVVSCRGHGFGRDSTPVSVAPPRPVSDRSVAGWPFTAGPRHLHSG